MYDTLEFQVMLMFCIMFKTNRLCLMLGYDEFQAMLFMYYVLSLKKQGNSLIPAPGQNARNEEANPRLAHVP